MLTQHQLIEARRITDLLISDPDAGQYEISPAQFIALTASLLDHIDGTPGTTRVEYAIRVTSGPGLPTIHRLPTGITLPTALEFAGVAGENSELVSRTATTTDWEPVTEGEQ